MKSKFSRFFSSILRFFKAIFTWLSRKIKVNRHENSIEIHIDSDDNGISDIAVTIQRDREMEE